MENCSFVMKVCIFLTCYDRLLSADTHTMKFLFTAVRGTNLPEFTAVGQVDEEEFVYYDSNIRKVILKTEWIKKFNADSQNYWNTEFGRTRQEIFKHRVASAMQNFNQTEGVVHTMQLMYGCELDDDGATRGYSRYGYDGEDFISLDVQIGIWITPKPQSEVTEKKWESIGHSKYCTDYLKYDCIETLKKFLSYSRETLERKVCPEVSLFQNHSSSPEVMCHATGFFPKAINITWQKDRANFYEDVELSETLPNQDGSFQKRIVLKVSAEELQKHKYTCVIQHSSLEEELVLPVSERRILRGGGSAGGSGVRGAPSGIIVCVIMCCVGLITIIGIMVWKKKISDYYPVQPKHSLDGDSSSSNS